MKQAKLAWSAVLGSKKWKSLVCCTILALATGTLAYLARGESSAEDRSPVPGALEQFAGVLTPANSSGVEASPTTPTVPATAPKPAALNQSTPIHSDLPIVIVVKEPFSAPLSTQNDSRQVSALALFLGGDDGRNQEPATAEVQKASGGGTFAAAILLSRILDAVRLPVTQLETKAGVANQAGRESLAELYLSHLVMHAIAERLDKDGDKKAKDGDNKKPLTKTELQALVKNRYKKNPATLQFLNTKPNYEAIGFDDNTITWKVEVGRAFEAKEIKDKIKEFFENLLTQAQPPRLTAAEFLELKWNITPVPASTPAPPEQPITTFPAYQFYPAQGVGYYCECQPYHVVIVYPSCGCGRRPLLGGGLFRGRCR